MENIKPPDFLKTDMSADDIIIAGMSINFYCQQESKMLPFEVDQDSNFLLEVYCVDGEFQGFIKLEPTYSEVPNRRACSLRFFRFSFHPARTFSCNKRKIPPCSFINLLSK